MVTQGRSTGVFAARLVFALTSDTHFGQALALSNTCGMCTQPGRGGLSAQTWGCDEQTPLSAAAAPAPCCAVANSHQNGFAQPAQTRLGFLYD